MCETNDVALLWYGERGIINALAMELEQQGLAGVKEFLSAITWGEGSQEGWINSVEQVQIVVEIGLAQFGNPDLLLICRGNNRTYMLSFEAKVGQYAACVMPHASGIATSGFNSSINGQLALKWRFAQALAAWDGNAASIVEPNSIHMAYAASPQEGGLGDTARNPRRLSKPWILNHLRQANAAGTPVSQWRFVVLSHDPKPFFAQDLRDNVLPLFLDGGDETVNPVPHLGWTDISMLGTVLGLGADYQQALTSMGIDGAAPRISGEGVAHALPRICSENRQLFSRDVQSLLTDITQTIRDECPTWKVDEQAGGVSAAPAGRVWLKVMPQGAGTADEHIIIGVSANLGRRCWAGQDPVAERLIGVGNNAQPFFVRRADDVSTVTTLCQELQDFHNHGDHPQWDSE